MYHPTRCLFTSIPIDSYQAPPWIYITYNISEYPSHSLHLILYFLFSHTLYNTVVDRPIPYSYNVQINHYLFPHLPLPHVRISGTYANELPPS